MGLRVWSVNCVGREELYCVDHACCGRADTNGGTGASCRGILRSVKTTDVNLPYGVSGGGFLTFFCGLTDALVTYSHVRGKSIVMLRCPMGGCFSFVYGVTRLGKTGAVSLVRSLNDFQQGGLAMTRRLGHLDRASCVVTAGRTVGL